MLNATLPSLSASHPLVKAQYGPGPTACWYLIWLSCLSSWVLNPGERANNSIALDLLAIVIFPTVASAHLVYQIWSWPLESSMINDETIQQMRALVSASLIITETYISLCLFLLLMASDLLARTPKLRLLLAFTSMFCIACEYYYLSFAVPSLRQAPGVFERSFITNVLVVFIILLALTYVLVNLVLACIYFILGKVWPEPIAVPPPGSDSDIENDYELANKSSPPGFERAYWFGCIATFIILFFIVFSVEDMYSVVKFFRNESTWTGRRGIFDDFFPRTEAGFMDLDQAFSPLIGLSALASSLYNLAILRYTSWWEWERERREDMAKQIGHERQTRSSDAKKVV